MTTTMKIHNADAIVVWPENTDADDYAYEHAIVVVPFSDSVMIQQKGESITVPHYAVKALLKALRDASKV